MSFRPRRTTSAWCRASLAPMNLTQSPTATNRGAGQAGKQDSGAHACFRRSAVRPPPTAGTEANLAPRRPWRRRLPRVAPAAGLWSSWMVRSRALSESAQTSFPRRMVDLYHLPTDAVPTRRLWSLRPGLPTSESSSAPEQERQADQPAESPHRGDSPPPHAVIGWRNPFSNGDDDAGNNPHGGSHKHRGNRGGVAARAGLHARHYCALRRRLTLGRWTPERDGS